MEGIFNEFLSTETDILVVSVNWSMWSCWLKVFNQILITNFPVHFYIYYVLRLSMFDYLASFPFRIVSVVSALR